MSGEIIRMGDKTSNGGIVLEGSAQNIVWENLSLPLVTRFSAHYAREPFQLSKVRRMSLFMGGVLHWLGCIPPAGQY